MTPMQLDLRLAMLGDRTMRNGQATFSGQRPRRGESVEYRLLVGVTFLLVLPVAALRRLAPRRSGTPRGSIVAEARETANTVIPIAFMA